MSVESAQGAKNLSFSLLLPDRWRYFNALFIGGEALIPICEFSVDRGALFVISQPRTFALFLSASGVILMVSLV